MDKNVYNIKEKDITYGRGYVYSLQYHFVWCTKYRNQILKDGIEEELKQMLQEIAEEYHFKIQAMEVMPDHIYLLLDCRPQFRISDMVKIMKGNTGEVLEAEKDKNRQFNLAEHLIHETKKNHASYPFDAAFPKMPSYLRRSAIRHALGSVSSYRTRMLLWEKGELSGRPQLTAVNHAMPVFYHKEMYRISRGVSGQNMLTAVRTGLN